MTIFIPKELTARETRVALIPDHAAKLKKIGADIAIESGAGLPSSFSDESYTAKDAKIFSDRGPSLGSADVVLKVRKPTLEEVACLRPGSVLAGLLDPFNSPEIVKALADRGVTAISMELLPRTTRAQKMDVLSSQSSLAGYTAVILAAQQSGKIFPMMMTPAGTIMPVKVFIIGVGVAGLQAIATAKRLGAKVEAYDPRPVVEEQVRSLGAQFLKIDLGETGQTKDGYAKALTEEQINIQRDAMKKSCSEADVVITAAQVFGRRAPTLVTKEMLDAMRPGSVVVDLAVESGGNVEGIVPDQIVERRGVKLVGIPNLAGCAPIHASQMYSSNMTALIEEFWDREAGRFVPRLEDELIQGALITHEGRIVNEKIAATIA
ncbi:MAG: Re/Si-specific NAD(P)(+) transhydrogenase subunit alpha [Spartobacteria bacterium]